MRFRVFLAAVAVAASTLAAAAQPAGAARLEYRLEALPGHESETSEWWDGSVSREVDTRPFLRAADFTAARITTRWCNGQAGCYNIRLIHTAAGTRTFRAVANRNRHRSFFILLDGRILQGFDFPPQQKGGRDDRQTIAYGPFTREQATTMVRRMNTVIQGSRLR